MSRMCCPDCGDLMFFHSGTVCPLKSHSDAFEKLKKENAELKSIIEAITETETKNSDYNEQKIARLEKENSHLKDKLKFAIEQRDYYVRSCNFADWSREQLFKDLNEDLEKVMPYER